MLGYVGYARICCDMLGYARICWDMLGYVGYAGICKDMVGYVRRGSARGEKPLSMLCKGFLFAPHGFYIWLESFLNWNALPVPLLRQVWTAQACVLETFCENKGLRFGVRFRLRFGMPFGVLFGSFPGSFWSLSGVLGAPLEDFWWTFAALGIAFEMFVGLWAS